MSEVDRKERQGGKKLAGLLKGLVGVGALAVAGKKVLDLYMESEDGDLMSSREYEDEVREIRNNYIEIDSGNRIELDLEELFDRSKVDGEDRADSLFLMFLDRVEEMIELPDKVFLISDIEKLIPFYRTDIDDKEVYNYSIMKMLSNLDGRNYVIFEANKNLRDVFAQECNNPHRNSRLWIDRYGDESFIINPKYIKGYEDIGGKE